MAPQNAPEPMDYAAEVEKRIRTREAQIAEIRVYVARMRTRYLTAPLPTQGDDEMPRSCTTPQQLRAQLIRMGTSTHNLSHAISVCYRNLQEAEEFWERQQGRKEEADRSEAEVARGVRLQGQLVLAELHQKLADVQSAVEQFEEVLKRLER